MVESVFCYRSSLPGSSFISCRRQVQPRGVILFSRFIFASVSNSSTSRGTESDVAVETTLCKAPRGVVYTVF